MAELENIFIPGISEPLEPVPVLESTEPNTSSLNRGDSYDQINKYFSERDEQSNTILEAREILGDSAKDLTDEQVYDLVSEVQFLVDSWLEEYEKSVFEGKTLEEAIGLK